MNKIKSIICVMLIMSTAVSCAQWDNGKKVKGNGDVTSINRSLGSYDGVKVAGSMDVTLVEGTEGNIQLRGESNLLEYVETKVSNNSLLIKVKDGFNLKTTRGLVITVPYEQLKMVALAGSGDINNTGTLNSEAFELALAGSGDINLNISSENTETKIAGSGDIRLSGTTTNLIVKVAGSGDFDGSSLRSQNVNVSVSGSGTAKVVCNGDLKARVSGSGDIFYSGNPKNRDTKVSGSGDIKG